MSDVITKTEPLESLDLGKIIAPEIHLVPALSVPADFRFGAVSSTEKLNPVFVFDVEPSLGPLGAFVGDWSGLGFNTIFRPNSPTTPTSFPVTPTDIPDNVLELNLTSETLSFSPSLGSVPNRGMVQADAFLNGVPYSQTISDITVHGAKSVGIHVEPGLWMAIPKTTDPAEGPTVSRMASIPHGTTINAQGTWTTAAGKPSIPAVSITPNVIGGGPVTFPSQTATNTTTRRIPQNLGPWITAGTITQAMLTDPNSVVRAIANHQTIVSTTQIAITTNPAKPILLSHLLPLQPKFGGGTDNIAFLDGDAALSKPNAQTFQMEAIFWIEIVKQTFRVPAFKPGQAPVTLEYVTPPLPGQPVQEFKVTPPHAIAAGKTITFNTTQIQYSQLVILNFNGLAWPHVSVATLVPSGNGTVPAAAWA
jgi:hypothetical protein